MSSIIKQTDRATAYAEKVAAGDVNCCNLHKLSCERHLNDLSRVGAPDFPYKWDPEKSEDILNFAETLTIIEGSEPRPVKLYDCQTFDLGVPMGWVNRSGYRRFRQKYKSVARQNGKTFENGITGTYIAGFGTYRFGKLFCVATGKKQARLAWEEMARFILADPDLAEFFYIKDYVSLIEAYNTGCTIEALSKEAGLQDGFRSVYVSLDEIHQHRDNSVYTSVYRGQRSMLEALLSMITTRGRDLSSFCYEMDNFCHNILEGGVGAEDIFADIYTLDPGDDIFDANCFPKSNPVLCATENGMLTMISDAQRAKDMGGAELADFTVKCQNLWLEDTDLQFVTSDMLKLAKVPETLERYRGCSAYAGIDLSHGGDLTTLALEFERPEGGYYAWSISFMPRGRLEEHKQTDLAPYDSWANQKLIVITGGESDYKNDYGFIISELVKLREEYDIKLLGIGYDPHNADGFLSQLEALGVPLLEVVQSARFLSAATEDVQILMKSGQYHFDIKNELLDWSFRNAKIVANSFGEHKVDKAPKARTKRIDPCDAVIDAHTCRMKFEKKRQIDVNKHMEEYLQKMGWSGKD